MIDITFLLALGLVFISLIVILGIVQEVAIQRNRNMLLSSINAIDANASRGHKADSRMMAENGPSKLHEEAINTKEETIC